DPIGLDGDYSGEADNTDGTNRLGTTLERYSVDVTGTGATMTITIRVQMNSEFEEIAFDDIQVTGEQLPKTISISGSENWRLMSAPLTSMTFNDLLGDIWTQGFTGADATSGTSNVYSYDETITTGDLDDGFTSITDQSATMTQGQGYAVYVYSDDNDHVVSGDAGFPKSLTFSGSSPTVDVGPVSVTFTTSGTASNDGWNLMGNPFASDLNVGLMGIENDSNIDNFAYVYSASTSSYLTLDAAAADSSTDQIAMGQGFFLKASSATTYTFPFASVGDGATLQKSVSATKRRDLTFTLSDSDREAEATIRFHTHATFEKDPYDGYYLRPFGNDIFGLFSVMDSESFVYNAFPYQIDGELSIPLDYINSESGSLTLEWDNLSVFPSEWEFTLVDNNTGSQVDLRTANEYTFEGSVNSNPSKVNLDSNPDPVVFKDIDHESRFTLLISQTTVSNEEEVTVERFGLDQNYPNPFNPTTNIRYTVPNSGMVNVSIYNVMGQKVATLVNSTQSAGTYTATWNAANSASGIYYYRLESAGQSITRQMTLIK
ncbi:MAG: T9SS type A sorting domain-containing protein, partial [Bacteroidota bacterium]